MIRNVLDKCRSSLQPQLVIAWSLLIIDPTRVTTKFASLIRNVLDKCRSSLQPQLVFRDIADLLATLFPTKKGSLQWGWTFPVDNCTILKFPAATEKAYTHRRKRTNKLATRDFTIDWLMLHQ